jgi:hypothetical protein
MPNSPKASTSLFINIFTDTDAKGGEKEMPTKKPIPVIDAVLVNTTLPRHTDDVLPTRNGRKRARDVDSAKLAAFDLFNSNNVEPASPVKLIAPPNSPTTPTTLPLTRKKS